MRKLYETAIILVGTLGWWGFVYPELSMTEEAYVQEAESQEQQAEREVKEEQRAESQEQDAERKVQKEQDTGCGLESIGESLAGAGLQIGDIRIKSRLAEYVYQVKEFSMTEKEAEDDK